MEINMIGNTMQHDATIQYLDPPPQKNKYSLKVGLAMTRMSVQIWTYLIPVMFTCKARKLWGAVSSAVMEK
jgi:hypothetical protein